MYPGDVGKEEGEIKDEVGRDPITKDLQAVLRM